MSVFTQQKKIAALVGLHVSLIALVTLGTSVAHAKSDAVMSALNTDGWHSWQVEAVANAPDMCCGVWHNDQVTSKTCNLDSTKQSFGSFIDDDDAVNVSPASMQVYAKVVAGKTTKIHTLSNLCEVKANSPIKTHANIGSNDSVAWLGGFLNPRTKLSAQSLQSISLHAGDDARNLLVATAQRNKDIENRKEAVFWMGQVRVQETFNDLERIVLSDPSNTMREHAIFSLSQSDHSRRSATITQAGKTDADPSVRGKAWFWLAQSDDQNAEQSIVAALDQEKNQSVRDEAIFALAQFSDERAANALIRVIENKRYTDKDRKQALFWLAQSDSEQASRYLSSVFDD